MSDVRVKIVLDADVIIHFAKGELLATLPSIFPHYDFIVLSHVYEEVLPPVKLALDNIITLLQNIKLERFEPRGEMLREYALLSRDRGKGESACMSYCRFTQNALGSSNLRDIAEYCKTHGITYLTTIDFLYYGIQKRIITRTEADEFIERVKKNGSKLPIVDFDHYIPVAVL